MCISGKNITDVLSKILTDFIPDIIHIWGTEYKHTYDSLIVLREKGLISRTVVSIQGLVSVYANHYSYGIPAKIISHRTLSEIIKHNNIEDVRNDMIKRGMYEVASIKIASNCIGRTDWDYACAKMINPQITYHKCNEILRTSFYQSEWKLKKCIKHQIFFSQATYPIKGFHIMLDALKIIKKKYPDVKLCVVGHNPYEKKTFIEKLKKHTYPEYLRRLIFENHIEDNIEWLGTCDEQEMVSQFLEANVFVCSSLIENSSNSVCEAMLLGVPVVASDVGGIKSLMEHGKEGLIYQTDAPYMLAYSVMKIFEDDSLAQELGRCARKRALNTHSVDTNIRVLNEIYKTINK